MSHFVQKYQIIGRVPATQRFDGLLIKQNE